MTDIKMKSSLSDEEIKANFKDIDFFSGVVSGLEEALAYKQGKAKAATIIRKRNLPNVDVATTRKALDLTQKAFAKILGVSPRTVEAWESGKTTPTPTAKKLMYLLSTDHSLVKKLQ